MTLEQWFITAVSVAVYTQKGRPTCLELVTQNASFQCRTPCHGAGKHFLEQKKLTLSQRPGTQVLEKQEDAVMLMLQKKQQAWKQSAPFTGGNRQHCCFIAKVEGYSRIFGWMSSGLFSFFLG